MPTGTTGKSGVHRQQSGSVWSAEIDMLMVHSSWLVIIAGGSRKTREASMKKPDGDGTFQKPKRGAAGMPQGDASPKYDYAGPEMENVCHPQVKECRVVPCQTERPRPVLNMRISSPVWAARLDSTTPKYPYTIVAPWRLQGTGVRASVMPTSRLIAPALSDVKV